MGKYTDYVMKTAQDLLAVPSPSGFTHMAAEFVKKEFENLGYKPQITQKGAVLVKLGGKTMRMQWFWQLTWILLAEWSARSWTTDI